MRSMTDFEIKCPYCYTIHNADVKDSDIIECSYCGHRYKYKKNINISYTMFEAEEENDAVAMLLLETFKSANCDICEKINCKECKGKNNWHLSTKEANHLASKIKNLIVQAAKS